MWLFSRPKRNFTDRAKQAANMEYCNQVSLYRGQQITPQNLGEVIIAVVDAYIKATKEEAYNDTKK